jgi:hypothetical protein
MSCVSVNFLTGYEEGSGCGNLLMAGIKVDSTWVQYSVVRTCESDYGSLVGCIKTLATSDHSEDWITA